MSDRATLVQIYIAFYNRAPDPEGLDFWQIACDGGLSLAGIADLFVPQDESIGTYPFLGNPSEDGIRSFLQAVYENLFNRELDDAGETFWTNQILKSLSGDPDGLSIGEVVLSIITGAQGDDITTLANKTEVALDFHDQAAALDDYVQNPAATTASRLALSVVDDSDFSVVQGKVLNENYFEEFDGQGNPLFVPFEPGIFDPIVGPNQTALDEAPVNGIILDDQRLPNVAVLADGKVVTVYQSFSGLNDVAINIRNADGSLTQPDISVTEAIGLNPGGASLSDPKIAALPDGGFVIMTSGSIFTEPPGGIFALQFDSMGAFQGDPVLVFSNDEFEGNNLGGDLGVTYMPTGNLLYTISGVLDGDTEAWFDPVFRIMTPDGIAITDPQTINDDENALFDEEEVASASLPDGTSLIVYKSNGDPINKPDVFGRLIDAEGNPLGQPFLVHEILNGAQDLPQVSALGEDRFVVVFETDSGEFDPSIEGISAVILNRDGSVDVDEFPVNTREANDQRNAQVTELPNGNFVVVWQSPDSDSADIRARVFEDDGTPVTDDILVNTLTTGSQTLPAVAATEDGFVVTWQNFTATTDDPFGTGLRMAAFDEDGVRLPLPQQANPTLPVLTIEEFQVNDQVNSTQQNPSVVGLPDGGGVFSYLDIDSGESFFEIRDANGVPQGPEMPVFGPNGSARDVEMFATPDGGFVMVGRATLFGDGLGNGILMQIFDADLNPGDVLRVNTTPVTSGTTRDSQVTVDGDGNIIVGWTFTAGANPSVLKLRKFDADGDALTAESEVASVFNLDLALEALTVAGNGSVLAVAQTENGGSPTSLSDIYMAVLDSDLTVDVKKMLPVDHASLQIGAAAAPLENGNFLVVFGDQTAPGDSAVFGITGIIVDQNGNAVGPEFLVNVSTVGNQVTPDATVLSDGRILVSWAGENTTAPGLGQDIWGRIFNADGTVATGEFVINDLDVGNQTQPDIAAAGDGFVASWLTDPTFSGTNPADINGTILDGDLNRAEVPLVLRDNTTSFLTEDDFLNLQDIPLNGSGFFIAEFGAQTSLGAVIDILPMDIVRYNPLTAFWEAGTLPDGDQVTDIFTYTVENANGDQVELIGSVQVQAFEDIIP